MDFEKLTSEISERMCELMNQHSGKAMPPEESSRVFAETIVFAIKRYEEMKD